MGKRMKRTLHLLGLPHTQTTRDVTVCAFTSKTVKFSRMMTALGYKVIVYSGEHNDAECAEHVPIFTDWEQHKWYGGNIDPNFLPSIATWNSADVQWVTSNGRAAEEIEKRADPQDVILLTAGLAQKPISDALPHMISAEWAVGYDGAWAPYRCYESYAWKHYLWGKYGVGEGRWYDTVIPNFFDEREFSMSESKGDFLLFVGRMIRAKGIQTAVEIAKSSGMKLVMAGSGVISHSEGRIECEDGTVLEAPGLEYVGTVNAEERNKLMGEARALLVPTSYIEPFGAVAVEAQLVGTPVVATDWGAFTETVDHGRTGYRFSTLAQGVEAVEKCANWELGLSPSEIRANALRRWSLESIGPLYEEWLERIDGLWGDGWYATPSVARKVA